MGYNAIPQVPSPPTIRTIEDADAYIKLLYTALSKWQTIMSNTGFLGTPAKYSGYLFFETSDPTSLDGNDGDVWISY